MTYPCNVTPMPSASPAVNLIQGSQIVPESVEWLWYGWLATGKLHVFAGPPGSGKTTIALAIAATLTTGGRWPDGSQAQAGSVLIWSGEDGVSDTLVPRLLACGADMSKVFFVGSVLDGGEHHPFDPAQHMDALADRARQIGDVKLLIVDPIVSAIQGDSHKNAEVRRSLQPLVDLGAETGAAIVGITHFSKGGAGSDPAGRVIGSIAFSALARLVWVADKVRGEDGEPDKRILARAKSNLGPDNGGFCYSVDQCELAEHPGVWASRIWWGEQLDGTARELLRTDDDAEDDRSEVDAWLRELLQEEGEITKADAVKAGKACGFSVRTIERAHKRIGAASTRKGFGRDKVSVWSLAGHAEQSAADEADSYRAASDGW